MFIAAILYCTSFQSVSCQVIFNSEAVFPTYEACMAEGNNVAVVLPYTPDGVITPFCIQIPGEPV